MDSRGNAKPGNSGDLEQHTVVEDSSTSGTSTTLSIQFVGPLAGLLTLHLQFLNLKQTYFQQTKRLQRRTICQNHHVTLGTPGREKSLGIAD